MSLRCDLHTHTTASDGRFPPVDLLHRAVEKKVDLLAICDHDTLAGNLEAQAWLAENPLPLHLISGVEISTRWEGFEIHILGLAVDPLDEPLQQFLLRQQERREARVGLMAAKLERLGVTDALSATRALAPGGLVTRAHFAQLLIDRGLVSSKEQAFDRYLSKGKKGYVAAEWGPINEAVAAIQAAGGVAVLAHPGRYGLSTKWVKRLIGHFKEVGGHALEVAQPQIAPQERANFGQWAKEHDLAISVGSDFHSPGDWLELGRGLWLPKEGEPIWLRYPEKFALPAAILALVENRAEIRPL